MSHISNILMLSKPLSAILFRTEGSITLKPFLKWVGGKGRVISQLEKYFPSEYGSYFEPFVGGGAVYFDIEAKIATINDINKSLVGAYINIRDHVDLLIKELTDLQQRYYSLDEDKQKQMFYEIRDEYNDIRDKSSLKKSALLIFLNKTCFNGMYRENRSGKFNVPFGKHQKPTICDENNLRHVANRLKNTTILSETYKVAIKEAKAGDFVYLDPPYHPINPTSSFTSYSEADFLEKDQVELKELIDELTTRKCKVMLSNSDTPFIQNLYRDYRKEYISVARSINANGDGRGKISEIVVLNY